MLDTELQTIWHAYVQMNNLLTSLPAHTYSVVSKVLDTGVTPDIIGLAAASPKEEWQRYQILRITGNGNPGRIESLTELAMDEIRIGLETGALP